ncbi:DUF4226 domain-containing protein [Nocardia asteroides]|uniref:DUF4226 domain-containing protein n=1 Tax=Nocardia asteroides TaxID=1824 RepID=UPI001E432FCC|nr:DUF4226 domain-containing protein [Nocardia asteroides]UGT63362.1 DUF4226 domain-containing protein [Nocardia asteroides]
MTSTEVWSIAEPVDAEPVETPESGSNGAVVTPWSGRGRGGRGGLPAMPAVSAPGTTAPAVSAPGTAAPAASMPQHIAIPGLPGMTVPAALLPPALRPLAPGGGALPGSPAAVPAAPVPAQPQAVAAPPAEPPPPALDADTVAAVLPAATMAGTMALGMLPTLADALLGGGGSSGTSGGAPASGSTTAPGGGTATAGLSPQDQRVLELLKALAAAYGDGETKDPEVVALRKELGLGTGTGSGAESIQARRLYQANFANAYNTLDNQLAGYITRTAGTHKVDRTTINNLLREVNIAINELGPQAYTRQGQQQIHKILTAALVKANAIAGNTNTGNTDTATFINQLTGQYLNNIAGRKTPVSGGAGAPAGGKAKIALDTARAQFGKPYVWGAEGPNSFDCSGLMQYAAKAAGVNIPRVAADQYRQLPKVTGPLQPGDLVFPESSFENGVPGHVIMYAGNGRCYAASRSGVPLGEVPLPKNYRAARWA